MANNASELERLRNLVNELEEREVKLEGNSLSTMAWSRHYGATKTIENQES
jgi:hypothetical protein